MTAAHENTNHRNDPLGGYISLHQFERQELTTPVGSTAPGDHDTSGFDVNVGDMTPWGEALWVSTLTQGLISVGVPSGKRAIKLSPELETQVPAEWRSPDGWYVGTLQPHYVRATFPWAFGHDLFTEAEILADAQEHIQEHPQANAGPSFARHMTPDEIAAESDAERNHQSYQDFLIEFPLEDYPSGSGEPDRSERFE